MRGLIILVCALLLVSQAQAFYQEGRDSKGSYTVTDAKNYPIIFVPGVGGSDLEVNGRNVWPGYVVDIIDDSAFDALYLDENGNSNYNVQPVKSLRFGIEGGQGAVVDWNLFPVYQGFFDFMQEQGYTEDLKDKKNGLKVYDFAYDWRYDNRITAEEYFPKIVNKALKETKSDKVIIFAHSMGGIVTRLYLKDRKNAQKVAAVVFMGTPHGGSPKPFIAYTQGYNFGNAKLTNEKMWEIMSYWPAGYQLLPPEKFVSKDFGIDDWSMEKIMGQDWVSEWEYERWQKEQPSLLRRGLPDRQYAQEIVEFHKELGISVDHTDIIDYFMLEGVNQDTTVKLRAVERNVQGLDIPVVRFEEEIGTGDATVPYYGAQVNGIPDNRWFQIATTHGEIPSDEQSFPVLSLIKDFVLDHNNRTTDAGRIRAYTNARLSEVRSWPDSSNVFSWLRIAVDNLFNRANEEKVTAREELRGQAKKILKHARIQVVVSENTDRQEHFYLVVDNYELVDSGTGKLNRPTIDVKVTDHQSLHRILSDEDRLRDALASGNLKFSGRKIVDKFKFTLYNWFSNWGN